jgi:hypothetical protein
VIPDNLTRSRSVSIARVPKSKKSKEGLSLEIDIDRVIEVLLPDGKWHQVKKSTFAVVHHLEDQQSKKHFNGKKRYLHLGHDSMKRGSSTQATWLSPDGRRIICPMTSVLAVVEEREYI